MTETKFDNKKCDITWLEYIPPNWSIKRLKDFSLVVRGGSPRPAGDLKFYEGNIPFLKVGDLTSNENIYLEKYTYTIKSAGLVHTRLVKANTIMLTNSGATLGIPKICTFTTTFNDGIAAFIGIKNVDKKFLFYFLKTTTEWFLNQASLGQGQPNLNTNIIGNTFFPYPPISEQNIIANYLEAKTLQIDKKKNLLSKKVTKYKELKHALISETVTQGLDKTVDVKDSGIVWIDKIPTHWKLKRGKDVFKHVKNRVGLKSHSYDILSLTLNGVIKRNLENMKGKIPASFDNYKIAEPNNLVLCLFDMDVTPRIVGYVDKYGIITSAYTILKGNNNVFTKYFFYYYLEQNRNNSLLSNSKTLRSTMTYDLFSQLQLPFPPFKEQIILSDD